MVQIFLTVLFLCCSRFFYSIFAIPANLKHLPLVSTWALFKSYLAAESDDVRIKRLLLPFADRGESVVLVWALGIWTVHILDEGSAFSILKNVEAFPKQVPSKDSLVWRLLGPTSIALANGDTWQRNSLIIREGINSVVPIPSLVKLSQGFIEIIGANLGLAVNISDLAYRYSFDALSSTVIGHDFGAMHTDSEFVSEFGSISKELASEPLSLAKRIDLLGDDALRLLSSKRTNRGNDVTSAILDHPDMTDQERRDNIVSIFLGSQVSNPQRQPVQSLTAGRETTVGAIASAIYYLAQYPETQAKARAEVLEVLGPSDPPSSLHITKLEYVDACVRETLRCNPPGAYLIGRINTKHSQFGNYNIPPETILMVNLYTILHCKKTFPDPHKFARERFLRDDRIVKSWIPFGRGLRRCPGNTFAILEQTVLICMLLREYSWYSPTNSQHKDGLKNALSSFSTTVPQSLEILFARFNGEGLSADNKDESFRLQEITSKKKLEGPKRHIGSEDGLAFVKCEKLRLANLLRGTANKSCWIEGWALLGKRFPSSGLHPLLLSDVEACAETYRRVNQGLRSFEYLDLSMTVVGKSDVTSLTSIGPKGMGGDAWRSNKDYERIQPIWSCPGFAPLSPCVVFTWIALLKKIVPVDEIADCIAYQLLSTVDYDLDHREEDKNGFLAGLTIAARRIKSGTEETARGAALTGLISMDLQTAIRDTQQDWVRHKGQPMNLGLSDIEPRVWVAANVGDCSGLAPFAYQSASDYARSRIGMFAAMVIEIPTI
ncbi:hypothetical protein HYALB_00013197 [Hymenoscyphus albidus]|uniref:Cytochrome P450 n=1 Tax=Hymenoscyphus albidus TaxID=595503 RepID=A0A9N9PXU1_9HELO|nr:hypothetical protein HYALB_00013197 [Hymenoscyphus albidus]